MFSLFVISNLSRWLIYVYYKFTQCFEDHFIGSFNKNFKYALEVRLARNYLSLHLFLFFFAYLCVLTHYFNFWVCARGLLVPRETILKWAIKSNAN